MDKVLFSSNKMDWATPQEIVDGIGRRYKLDFTLDVCATESNAKCINYFTPEEDGLKQDWKGVCWMNPPYGVAVYQWMEKAFKEVLSGGVDAVACLLPSRTDTKWFHDFATKADVILFIRGRIKFIGGDSTAPFPSLVLIFTKEHTGEPKIETVRRDELLAV